MKSRKTNAYIMLALFLACPLAWTVAAQEAEDAPAHGGFGWNELPPMPSPMGGQFVGVHNGALIVAGGTNWPVSKFQGGTKEWLDTVYVLEKGEEGEPSKWIEASKLEHPIAYGVAASHSSGIYCAGGTDGEKHLATAFKLEWTNGALARVSLPDLPRPCAYAGAAMVGDTMYVVGGLETPDSKETTNNFWALNVTKLDEGWRELEPWPGPSRILPAVASQAKGLYVISGANWTPGGDGALSRTYLADAYCYTPDTPDALHPGWKTVAAPPRPVAAAPCIGYGASHIFVFSGDDGTLVDQIEQLGDDHPGYPHDILGYHTITDTWTVMGSIPETYLTTQAVMLDGQIVIAGGEDRPGARGNGVLAGKPVGSQKRLAVLDYVMIVGYFGILILMGFYFSRRENTTDDFFLGGKRVPWWAAGLSIYGTLLSAITFMTVPATAYSTNWVFYVGQLAIIVVIPVVIFGYLPVFRRLNITTAYEYLEQRFNVAVRLFGSSVFIIFQLGRVGIVMLLPALALEATTGIDVKIAIITMGVLCTLYTVLGGIEAVIWTDVLQVIVLVGGAILSLVLIIFAVDGGLPAIIATGVEDDKFRIFNWGWDFTKQVFWVVVAGRVLEAMIPYTTDQTVIQRYLTTRTTKQARNAVLLGASFSIPNALVFFGLGTALFAFYKGSPHLLDPNINTDAILPLFIVQQLPVGIAGLVIAALFAAAMSSLDSSLNSMSAVIVTDFYRRFKKDVSEHFAMRLARWLTVVLGIFGTAAAWMLAVSDITSLWQQYMKFIGLFGGSLAGIFALALFTKRASGTGALIGAVAGASTLFYVQRFTDISFLLYSSIGICTSFIVGYAASLVFPARPKAEAA